MKTIIKISTILLMTFLSINMFGQNNSVTIGGAETITDAVLWLIPSGNEGKQGLVLPQVERTGFVPSMDGMIIFDPSDQTIYVWDGAEWQGLGSGGTGTADDWGTQTVVTDPVLTGEGTAIDPLTLAPQDAGLGQVLKWNGSTWAPALDETGAGGSSVNSVNEITGDGTLANPLQLAQQAATVGQILKWDGTAWTPAEDAGGTSSTYLAGLGIEIDADNNIINTGDADADPANEFQTLSFDVLTNELSLSDGNSISIPTGGTDADADPTNEIQDLTLSGTTIEISGGAGVDIAALIPPGGTDDQNLIIVGDELSIEGGTGVIDLSVYGDDADADPTNEIQTITYSDVTGDLQLSSGGGTVTLPVGGFGAFESVGGVVRTSSVNDDDFVFGSDQLGDDPFIVEDDKRMFFDKSEGSFRVGNSADTDSWDDGNRGENSVAMGYACYADQPESFAMGHFAQAMGEASVSMGESTRAEGWGSVSLGYNTEALEEGAFAGGFNTHAIGYASTAMGNEANAEGANSTAMGFETLASGENSTAFGKETTASGINSTALGEASDASGQSSTALGNYTIASGNYSVSAGNGSNAGGGHSFAMGYEAQATGPTSVAMGESPSADGWASVSLGRATVADADFSFATGFQSKAMAISSAAFGSGTESNSLYCLSTGIFNVGNGDPLAPTSTNPLFEIGNGSSDGNRSNAFTVLRNGRVGISESEPNTNMVIGNNFDFFGTSVPAMTVGGIDAPGGAIVIGNPEVNFWLQSSGGSSGILSREPGLPNDIGDFNISARTLRVGTTVSDHLYKLDVRQSGTYGFHLSQGDYGWEHSVDPSNGDLMLYTDVSGGPIGCFEFATGIYTALSDRKTKEDVKAIGSVLAKVNELEPLRYQFIGVRDNKKSLGFIAQDVKEIFPELVTFHAGTEGRDDRHLMNYSGFGVVAIAAIQEQQDEIEDLKSTIEALMKRVECMENK